MKLFGGRKIIGKLVVILTTVVAIISALSVIYFSKTNANALSLTLANTIKNLVEIAKHGYAAPVWNLNRNHVRSVNLAILSNANIVAINIYESNRFFDGMKKDLRTMKIEAEALDTPFSIAEKDSYIKMVSCKLTYDNKNAGSFELFYTERLIKEEIARRNKEVIISFIIIALAMISVIFLVAQKSLINPILALSDVSKGISENKDYSVRIEKKNEDEIGDLYDSFNIMIMNIEHSESELIKTKGYLSNIIQSMPSMLISVDEQGTVTQWNHAAELTTGIKAPEILGKNIWKATSLFDDYKDSYRNIIGKREPIHFYRKKYELPELRYRNVSLFPLVENGVSGMVIRMDDVTEMEKKEEQLRQSQKMETVGTLAGGLAHDFNNVLGGIVGTISILKFKLNKGMEIPLKSLKDYVETIERAGQRAADMVQQLLTLSRKQEISFAPVDLNLTIKHVFKICSNTIDKAVELKPCYTKEPAMVNADPGQMEQVLLNLSVNAGHAMTIMKKPGERQGGTLTISVRMVQADRFFCSNHPEAQEINYWVLSVQDTGTGMDSKTVAKIFDPFFTTKEKGKGTGLGLSMVYNIVQQHSGFIDVYSEIGLGTTFSVYLPSIEGVHGVAVCQEESIIAKGEGVVLVVDDEAIMRELAQDILTECGYEVLLAENGEEGVKVFQKEHDKIDMVLLNMVMPKKSGKEAFVEMKNIDADVKVLLSSGFRKDDRVEGILSLGVKGFIQKPFTIERLADAIRETIKG